MTVEKPKPNKLLRPITTGAGSVMRQSRFLAIICNSLKAREKSCVHGAIGFASQWLKNWHKSFKPITKCSNRNHVITFNSYLKTALIEIITIISHTQRNHTFNFFLVVAWKGFNSNMPVQFKTCSYVQPCIYSQVSITGSW